MHTGWDDEQQRKIDTVDELTAENATLRAQLAEAVRLLRDCTNAYVDPDDRLRALDRAESWMADYDNPTA